VINAFSKYFKFDNNKALYKFNKSFKHLIKSKQTVAYDIMFQKCP